MSMYAPKNARTFELRPVLSSQASFYRKAMVVDKYLNVDNHCISVLYSYDTPVGLYDFTDKAFYISDVYSNTTTRHLKDFAYLYTGKKMTTAELMKHSVAYFEKIIY